MIFCVPGPWQDRSDFIRRVVNSESDGRYVYDGDVLADVRHQDILKVEFLGRHPRMLKAFQAASRGDLPQGQCLAMGMSFSEKEKNLFAGHLRRDFLSSRA